MKITIDIDCTPQELRAFLGLPHIEPMQDALIAQMQERLAKYLEAMDPEAMMKLWLPGGMQGLAEIQERFWTQLMSGMAGTAGTTGKSKRAKG
jgi:Tfp pilus assembly PilM family ATPase